MATNSAGDVTSARDAGRLCFCSHLNQSDKFASPGADVTFSNKHPMYREGTIGESKTWSSSKSECGCEGI